MGFTIGAVIGFDSDEEAIAIANDSDFGLGGGIFSANVGLAYEMALQMRTGTVGINGGNGSFVDAWGAGAGPGGDAGQRPLQPGGRGLRAALRPAPLRRGHARGAGPQPRRHGALSRRAPP